VQSFDSMRWLFLFVFCLRASYSIGYDTLHISLEEAEARFLKNNLLLLAEQYNVEAQSALVIQSRLWANPRISAELNAYNPGRSEYFDVGRQGQKAFAFEQLIYLGGKRKNQIAFARQQSQLATYEFEDLLRNLKFQLRRSFYSIYYDEQTLEQYTRQLQLLSSIIAAYQVQSEKGNIPLKEVLRLKAVYYQLNNDKTELMSSILNEEATLQVLLREEVFIQPISDLKNQDQYKVDSLDINTLVNQALDSRPDYKIATGTVELANVNYRLQRSLAVPDVTLGGTYDQRGGAFVNQKGVTMAIDLPVLNRNQGNIKYSQFVAQKVIVQRDNKKLEITSEVQSIVQKLIRIDQEYANIDKSFTADFESLNEGVIKNFQKRNVSLLEFVDFFVSYNETLHELNKLRKTRIETFEELNASVGTELFK